MTVPGDALVRHLEAIYPPGVVYGVAVLLNFDPTEYSLAPGDFDLGANTIQATGNNYVAGTRVAFNGVLSSPLVNGKVYYVITTGTVIQVSETLGGAVVDLQDAGFGAITLTEVAPVATVDGVRNFAASLADLSRWEVDYQGQATRPQWTPPNAVYDEAQHRATLPRTDNYVDVDNTAGAGAIEVNAIVMVKGGSLVRLNTTGAIDDIILLERGISIPANAPNITRVTLSNYLNG